MSKSQKHAAGTSPDQRNINPDSALKHKSVISNQLLKMLSLQNITEPECLSSTEKPEVEKFLKSFEDYQKEGGKESALTFIEASLLTSIKKYELNVSVITEVALLNYLRKGTKPSSAEDIYNLLENEISVDPAASTGKNRLLSLMTSLEKAVAKLGLDESTPNADGFILPFCKKKEVVLSKLPEDFQDQFRKYDSLRVSASNDYELYSQLKEVCAMYNGSWEHYHPASHCQITRIHRHTMPISPTTNVAVVREISNSKILAQIGSIIFRRLGPPIGSL